MFLSYSVHFFCLTFRTRFRSQGHRASTRVAAQAEALVRSRSYQLSAENCQHSLASTRVAAQTDCITLFKIFWSALNRVVREKTSNTGENVTLADPLKRKCITIIKARNYVHGDNCVTAQCAETETNLTPYERHPWQQQPARQRSTASVFYITSLGYNAPLSNV